MNMNTMLGWLLFVTGEELPGPALHKKLYDRGALVS